jgi:ribonuclease J
MPEAALSLFPLGGLGEIGMNCLALEQRGEVLLIDCGVTFDDRGLGVDVVHPSFEALEPYRDRIAGVAVTHGHEDHIGALPYLLRRFDVPVYAPPYALGLLGERLREHEILRHAHLHEMRVRQPIRIGSFEVEPIRVTHSIADATALAIRTDAGLVVHSGDFKIDPNPPDGELFDAERFEELGDEGVELLLSDSTNVDSEGTSGSEEIVGEALERIVAGATGAVVVGLFASNVHRLRVLGEVAVATGRKLVLLGRSVQTHSRVAHSTGYLGWPSGLVYPDQRLNELPRNRILAIATGTQAESRAALGRLAREQHPALKITTGDTVILSSRVIPGHEPEVSEMMSDLMRLGAEVITRTSDRRVHVSGHAYQDEQVRLLELTRPRSFLPVHGTLRHLQKHAAIARDFGTDARVIENGQKLILRAGLLEDAGRVPSGRVYTFAQRPIDGETLRERAALAETGIVVAFVPVDAEGRLVAPIALTTRGIAAEGDPLLESTLAAARGEATRAVEGLRLTDEPGAAARTAIRRTFFQAFGSKPVCQVMVQGVGRVGGISS